MNTMKSLRRIAGAFGIVAAVLALLVPSPAPAQVNLQKTIWAVTDFTNNPAVATNLAAVVDATAVTDFSLEVIVNLTNASAGTLSLAYETANQTSTFSAIPAGQGMAPSAGWWSIPLSNNSTRVQWTTNITMNSVGYWRCSWLTNLSVQHITNISIRAYIKPARTRKDY